MFLSYNAGQQVANCFHCLLNGLLLYNINLFLSKENNMYGYIYKTTNLINGKIYVGQHKFSKDNIDRSYIGSGIHLKHAVEYYGKDNFKCEILE